MKKTLVMLASFFILPLLYLIQNHWNYGDVLPPQLPSDIRVVDGKIISGRRTLFEDGQGFVIDIQSGLPYREVVNFYAEQYQNSRLESAPGLGAEFAVADFRLGSKRILLEIHSGGAFTSVTMAIHLGQWW